MAEAVQQLLSSVHVLVENVAESMPEGMQHASVIYLFIFTAIYAVYVQFFFEPERPLSDAEFKATFDTQYTSTLPEDINVEDLPTSQGLNSETAGVSNGKASGKAGSKGKNGKGKRRGTAAAAAAAAADGGQAASADCSDTEENHRARQAQLPSKIACHNPATGEYLGELPVWTDAQVREGVKRARNAQQMWKATSFAERRRVLEMFKKAILEHQTEICESSVRDSGKNMLEAVFGEVFVILGKLDWTIRQGEAALRSEQRSPGLIFTHKTATVEYRPRGVVAAIAPWNYPFHHIMSPTIAALMSGNAIMIKVSELTSWSSVTVYRKLVNSVLKDAGYPCELVQIVTGYGPTGAALIKSGVDLVLFTGSPENGKRVMETASSVLVPVVLELGGKDAMIVCDDCAFDAAVVTAMRGVWTNAGQNCIGVERIYVQDTIYDRFVRAVVDKAKNLRQCPPLEGACDVSAMVMERQMSIVQEKVDDAIARGAKVLLGGRRNPNLKGNFYEPTVIVDVDHSMRIVKEEVFGPVMLIMKFSSDDEVVRLANDVDYGLSSGIFSTNYKRAHAIANQLDTGASIINDFGVTMAIQSLPFGGVKTSGFGKFNGPEGLRSCCYQKIVVTDRWGRFSRFEIPSFLHLPCPDGEQAFAVVEAANRLGYSSGITARLTGLFDMLKVLIYGAPGARGRIAALPDDAAAPSVGARSAVSEPRAKSVKSRRSTRNKKKD